ncbi:MAG: DUF2141 domain-containing protein [Sphingorhabdus sp.]
MAALTVAGVSQAAVEPTLDVSVAGLRNAKGSVLICLTANSKAFPDCSKDPYAIKRNVRAASAGHVGFSGVAPGTYALSVIHDENGNGKLDTALAIPKEGFGFSRNPKISFGPPKFTAAAFSLNEGSAQTVKMKYML